MRHGQFIHSCQAGMKDMADELLSKLPLRLMLAMYSCEIQASGMHADYSISPCLIKVS
jgi:hypothetical protein